MSDNPIENATLNRIGKIEQPEPYEYVTKTGKRKVVFPDPGRMEWTEAEQFMLNLDRPSSQVLASWLPEKDYETFLADKLSFREFNAVMEDVRRHYKDIFGDQGEEPASDD